jgi:ATP-dependent Lon protease
VRDSALFEQLKKLGAFRAVASPAALDQTLDALKRLRSQQPHFAGVIELIEGRIHLAREMAVPLHLPPVLLVGPPGVGKTHFTLQLAEALGRPIHRHSFDSSHTGDALCGSDRHWANTQPGLVFNSVCLGDRADPVVVLDEIDKACIGYRSSNPLTPLHGLLEPLTARAITDISVGLEFDASHVFWVATANDLRLVPEPIQTRFRIFHIQPPSAEQAIELAQTVASAVHARYPAFEEPDRRLTIPLAHLTPREQTQVLEQAYARALLNGRKYLNKQDLPAELLAEETGGPSSAPFLH